MQPSSFRTFAIECGWPENMPAWVREQAAETAKADERSGPFAAAFYSEAVAIKRDTALYGGPVVEAGQPNTVFADRLQTALRNFHDMARPEEAESGWLVFFNLAPHAPPEWAQVKPQPEPEWKATASLDEALAWFRTFAVWSREPEDGWSLCSWASLRIVPVPVPDPFESVNG